MKNAGLCANGAKVYSEQGLEKKKQHGIFTYSKRRTLCVIELFINKFSRGFKVDRA